MSKQIFFSQRTFARYDENHIVGYINEKVLNDYVGEDEQHTAETEQPKKKGVLAFQYDEVIIESKDESRDNLINGLIRLSYSETQEFAVLRHNSSDPEKYADEWKAYNDCVSKAKDEVSRWLN